MIGSSPAGTESMNEVSQHIALHLTVTEATRLVARVKGARYLVNRGIEVYLVPSEPVFMHDGAKEDGVNVMVRAETDFACGVGVGFLVAVSEGIQEMNDQCSLKDQLDTLDQLAAKAGLYDAQDWLRTVRAMQTTPEGTTPERSLTAFLEEISTMPVRDGVPSLRNG